MFLLHLCSSEVDILLMSDSEGEITEEEIAAKIRQLKSDITQAHDEPKKTTGKGGQSPKEKYRQSWREHALFLLPYKRTEKAKESLVSTQ